MLHGWSWLLKHTELNHSDGDGAFSLGMEGQGALPLSHWMLRARISHRTPGLGIKNSPFSPLDFATGRWGSLGCSIPGKECT